MQILKHLAHNMYTTFEKCGDKLMKDKETVKEAFHKILWNYKK